MTCEVLVMNRSAVVLAADSAVTVGRDGDPASNRYFKSVNKVFQLSKEAPIGIMINGDASLNGVPWEQVIKSYRLHLGGRTFGRLAEYADDFFSYLDGPQSPLPLDYRKDYLAKHIYDTAKWLVSAFIIEPKSFDGVESAARKAKSVSILSPLLNEADRHDFAYRITASVLQETKTQLISELTDVLSEEYPPQEIDIPLLLDVAFSGVAKIRLRLVNTGIVIAGYGTADLFPAYSSYTSYGTFGKTLMYQLDNVEEITQFKRSAIKAFAMRAMIDTFLSGMSPNMYASAATICASTLTDFMMTPGVTSPPNAEEVKAQLVEVFKTKLLNTGVAENYGPLTEVVASFPVEEMAELAETLVRLESLKEKVTLPSQSVGGPVDVAVITKSEGLIWIKRKHYFDPALNPRYFNRQRS